MNTFGTLDQLRCGCTDGIRIGHWCVCKNGHGDPRFAEYARERVIGHWIYNFTPDRRGARVPPEELSGLA